MNGKYQNVSEYCSGQRIKRQILVILVCSIAAPPHDPVGGELIGHMQIENSLVVGLEACTQVTRLCGANAEFLNWRSIMRSSVVEHLPMLQSTGWSRAERGTRGQVNDHDSTAAVWAKSGSPRSNPTLPLGPLTIGSHRRIVQHLYFSGK